MPLKLVPPREGRTKNWRIRGTYLRVYVDRSAGTPRKALAGRKLKTIEDQIERGEFAATGGKVFVAAALAYIKGGGEKRYLKPLIAHFGRTPLTAITQEAVDAAAGDLFPPGITPHPSPQNATINRAVHTPVSAVLAAGGLPLRLKRPRMPPGRYVWIEPEDAAAWMEKAPSKLRRLTAFLLYTGCRVTEACDLMGEDLSRRHRLAYIRDTKNADPRAVHLPPPLMAEIRSVTLERGRRVFGYRDRWEVYDDWNPLREALDFPAWWTPHACCHTWATWMRRYAGLDLRGLLGTGRWRDLKSVLRYLHADTTAESRAADRLPAVQNPCDRPQKNYTALKNNGS